MSVPKLRFKEFDGDWSNKKIGNIASKVGSGSTPRGGAEAYTDHGIIFIRSQNVNNDQLLLDDVAYIPEETHVKMSGSKVIANDILLNITGASIGRSCVVPHDFTEANVNQHVCIIRTPNDDPIFVQSFLSSENGQNAIQSKQAGGGREGLNFQAIRSIDFHFPPSKEEQTKIASFLSAVDEKINQLTQKHELLSQYKQGMMQKLFSQQIRFKADDGSEFGEWEKLTLSQISKHIGGTALESYVSECGDYNFISIGNYSTNGKYIDNSQRIILNEKTGTKLLDKDDLVMVLNDKTATGDLIGSTILINEDNKYIYNQRSERIICNKSKVLSVYLWHFLNSEMMRSEVRKLAQGGTQIYINFSSVLSIIFLLPCLAEQNKIANFLSAIDQKIEVVAQQIEQAKTWKKGLLQQMFV
ncbi:restriction endonuclease subunit S [Acinetobacter indicus]|uniref:restriction endonuclease subunit S n=1 Tax=Acinetobacter indicus TaxID=756892 RepID=UPI000CEC9660|nr:restriction endonuclease subunit S [Acinetobacter indicus]